MISFFFLIPFVWPLFIREIRMLFYFDLELRCPLMLHFMLCVWLVCDVLVWQKLSSLYTIFSFEVGDHAAKGAYGIVPGPIVFNLNLIIWREQRIWWLRPGEILIPPRDDNKSPLTFTYSATQRISCAMPYSGNAALRAAPPPFHHGGFLFRKGPSHLIGHWIL